ncbi:hypothetical protein [Clostridium sartagoforme]|uniref:hypothetical protein n=1 Tax=Clostridium sartagoforme TaxID=84031 RepID=UPI0031D6A5F5
MLSNIKKITSFTAHTTAEGERLSYTYSEIDENGTLVKSNERATCIVLDSDILDSISKINKFLLDRENSIN